jgi:hypothetical protein
VAGLALILAGALALNGTSHYPDLGALLPVAGAAAVIAAGIGRTHAVTRALAFRPLAWVGDLSYSWYLWHWPLIAFADGLWVADPTAKRLAAVVSIVPAWLSYRYIENPVRFRLRRTRRAVLAVAAVCVVVPLAAAGALVAAQRVVDRQPAMQNWQLATRPHGPFARHCANTPLTVPTNPTCTWPAHDAKGLVVAIGDSNVAHFTEPLANAGERLGLSIAVASLRGCAAAGTFTDIEGTATFGCDRFYAESQRAILRLRPRLVIFAEREDLYLRPTIRLTVHGTAGPADAGAKERLLALGIVRFLAPIQRAGIPVLIVHPIPAIPQPPNRCAVIRVLTDSCGTSISYAAAERNLEPSLRLERRAAAAIPGVAVLDVSKLVCPNGACRSMRGHEFVYYDWGHLTVQGALALTDTFRRVLELHARAD